MNDPLRLRDFFEKNTSLYRGLSRIIFDSTKPSPDPQTHAGESQGSLSMEKRPSTTEAEAHIQKFSVHLNDALTQVLRAYAEAARHIQGILLHI